MVGGERHTLGVDIYAEQRRAFETGLVKIKRGLGPDLTPGVYVIRFVFSGRCGCSGVFLQFGNEDCRVGAAKGAAPAKVKLLRARQRESHPSGWTDGKVFAKN